MYIAQTNCETSADGIEFMDRTLKTLIVALRAIRDQADSVLRKIKQPAQQRALAWKCAGCGHTEHFTSPALAEVAAPCPKCGGVTMESL
jgi:ribosomal protein S27E